MDTQGLDFRKLEKKRYYRMMSPNLRFFGSKGRVLVRRTLSGQMREKCIVGSVKLGGGVLMV